MKKIKKINPWLIALGALAVASGIAYAVKKKQASPGKPVVIPETKSEKLIPAAKGA